MSSELELENANSVITVGLSWETQGPKVDLDCCAVAFSSVGTLVDASYYNQLNACAGAITHSGDNVSGSKDGYDEEITVQLSSLHGVSAVVFLLSAYNGGNLKEVESASCHIKEGTKELAMITAGAYSGSKTGVLLLMIYRHADTQKWNFKKIIEPVNARHFVSCIPSMRKLVDGILDPGIIFERQLLTDKTFNMKKGDDFLVPPGITQLTVGLGWDTNGVGGIDFDASCLFLQDVDFDNDLDPVDGVYYADQRKRGVHSTGDDTTGRGGGDDECLVVDLQQVPGAVTTLAFCVNIYSDGKTFGNVHNAYVRLFDTRLQHEYCRYTLNKEKLGNNRGVIFCMLKRQRDPTSWSIMSVGEPCNGRTVKEIKTPLWDGSWDGGSHLFEVNLLSMQDPALLPETRAPTTTETPEGGCCTIQ